MRMEQLQYLCDIQQTKSINKTAEHFFISQQAVSNSIKKLESELGCQLLQRLSTGAVLTSEGEIVAEYAEQILEQVHAMKKAVLPNNIEGALDKSETTIYSNSIVLNNIISLTNATKDAKNLHLYQSGIVEIFDAIEKGLCDIGMVSLDMKRLQMLEQVYKKANIKIIMEDSIVACCNRDSVLADLKEIGTLESERYPQSVFALVPKEEFEVSAFQSVAVLNDITFHQRMLQQNKNFIVYMPSIAYKIFFSNRKFVMIPPRIQSHIVHAVILPENPSEQVLRFAEIIEKEIRKLD